jgi:3-oxoacyl-[acyl-carrier-protein] synthase-3
MAPSSSVECGDAPLARRQAPPGRGEAPVVDYGLAGFGVTLGDASPVRELATAHPDDVDRIIGYGYRHVRRAASDVGLTDLALEAGRAALRCADADPAEVDLVVLATTDLTEYLYWDAAASLAHRLGADRAECCLLTQACTTGVVAFDVVAGKFASHPDYTTALIVAANRTCEPYWDRATTQSMVFSDGAAAALARRGHAALRWLATEVLTDGRYADLYRMDGGGAAAPFGATAPDPDAYRARDAWNVVEFFDYDTTRFERFVRQLDENARTVVERACRRAGIGLTDIDRLCMLADNEAAMASLADTLHIPLERTTAALALEHGHLGAADPLFGLADLRARRDLPDGGIVALFSRGRGMHWACTLVQV